MLNLGVNQDTRQLGKGKFRSELAMRSTPPPSCTRTGSARHAGCFPCPVMVGRVGFEPTTIGLKVRYSVYFTYTLTGPPSMLDIQFSTRSSVLRSPEVITRVLGIVFRTIATPSPDISPRIRDLR